jgi:hypothetical protein
MVMITSVSIDTGSDHRKPTAEVKLASDKTSYERITVELTEEETAEVIKLVSEIIATRLRMPAIKEKLEAAKSVFPPPPAIIETPTGTASFTPDGYKPDEPKPGIICPIHNVGHDPHQDCPMCAEIASGFNERSRGMKPSDRLDDDIPF